MRGLTRPSVCFISCTDLFKTEGERKKKGPSSICLRQTLMSPPAFLLYLSPSLHLSLFPLSLPPQSRHRPAVGKSLIFLLRLLRSGISAVQCHVSLYSDDIRHAQTHAGGLFTLTSIHFSVLLYSQTQTFTLIPTFDHSAPRVSHGRAALGWLFRKWL